MKSIRSKINYFISIAKCVFSLSESRVESIIHSSQEIISSLSVSNKICSEFYMIVCFLSYVADHHIVISDMFEWLRNLPNNRQRAAPIRSQFGRSTSRKLFNLPRNWDPWKIWKILEAFKIEWFIFGSLEGFWSLLL